MKIKFTKGDYFFDSYGTSYVGHYFQGDDGFYYAGRNFKDKSKRILSLEEYKQAIYNTNSEINNLESQTPIIHHPNPEPEDYERGYIYRYLCQKLNKKSNILEISKEQYDSFGLDSGINSSIWDVVKIKWYITGEHNYIILRNDIEISKYTNKFPYIKTYLKVLTKYAKSYIE